MKVFCDLDGTLIDVSKRHYRVYSEAVEELGGVPIEKNLYWAQKRKKVKWDTLLPQSGLKRDDESNFLYSFIHKIEDPVYLKTDELFEGASVLLSELSKYHECHLVSLRRNRDNLLMQINELGISQYFTSVLTGHSENDGYDVKIALIKTKIDGLGAIVGDTEADIVTGKKLGLVTVAVTSGIRDREFLAGLHPDYLIDNISQAHKLLRG